MKSPAFPCDQCWRLLLAGKRYRLDVDMTQHRWHGKEVHRGGMGRRYCWFGEDVHRGGMGMGRRYTEVAEVLLSKRWHGEEVMLISCVFLFQFHHYSQVTTWPVVLSW